jgi:hypothetical protein
VERQMMLRVSTPGRGDSSAFLACTKRGTKLPLISLDSDWSEVLARDYEDFMMNAEASHPRIYWDMDASTDEPPLATLIYEDKICP